MNSSLAFNQLLCFFLTLWYVIVLDVKMSDNLSKIIHSQTILLVSVIASKEYCVLSLFSLTSVPKGIASVRSYSEFYDKVQVIRINNFEILQKYWHQEIQINKSQRILLTCQSMCACMCVGGHIHSISSKDATMKIAWQEALNFCSSLLHIEVERHSIQHLE